MKPKWKPHDDPQCACSGCTPMAPRTADEWSAMATLYALDLPPPDRIWTWTCDATAGMLTGSISLSGGDPGDEDPSR